MQKKNLCLTKRKDSLLMSVLYFFLLISPLYLEGQAGEILPTYYSWFDDIIGPENSELHYGIAYFEKHRAKSKKSKFFPVPDFVSGSVIFDNMPYYGLDLKYNVYEDELLMRVANQFGGGTLQLYKEKVEAFEIDGHHFVKTETSKKQNEIPSGFYEVLLEKARFSLLKKHRKLLELDLSDKSTFYEFEVLPSTFILAFNHNYYPVENVSDITSLFTDNADQMVEFSKKRPRSQNTEKELKALLNFLDTLEKESTSNHLPK